MGRVLVPAPNKIENIFRDSKHGAALRHLPSGYAEVNTAWMWGALLAATMAGRLHQLTATTGRDSTLAGWGIRDGKAMIAPSSTASSASPHGLFPMPDKRSCGYHPDTACSPKYSPTPGTTHTALNHPAHRPDRGTRPREPGTTTGPPPCPHPRNNHLKINTTTAEINSHAYSRIRVRDERWSGSEQNYSEPDHHVR